MSKINRKKVVEDIALNLQDETKSRYEVIYRTRKDGTPIILVTTKIPRCFTIKDLR